MPWIHTVPVAAATGRLAKSYQAAIKRAGRVFGIVRAMSLAPEVMDSSMALYSRIMYAEHGLSRRQREMIAVVVSEANHCHY